MKQRTILAILLATLLVVAPLVLASGPEGRGKADDARTAGDDRRANHTASDDDNETDDDNGTPRNTTARDAWRENRTALRDSFLARLHAMQTAWRENATAVREACHAASIDHENASKEQRTAHAHCIREGYSGWRVLHRVEMKELRAELAALFDAWHPRKHSS